MEQLNILQALMMDSNDGQPNQEQFCSNSDPHDLHRVIAIH